MNSATSVKFDAGHHAVVVLLGLGALLVLATRKDATVDSCTGNGHKCSSKLRPDLCNKESYVTITTFGQLPATMI